MIERISNVEDMKEMLAKSDKAVKEALTRLYKLQTDDERQGKHPDTHNGVGFNRYDAPMMMTLAERVIVYKDLKDDELMVARAKVTKYAGQLVRTNGININ